MVTLIKREVYQYALLTFKKLFSISEYIFFGFLYLYSPWYYITSHKTVSHESVTIIIITNLIEKNFKILPKIKSKMLFFVVS